MKSGASQASLPCDIAEPGSPTRRQQAACLKYLQQWRSYLFEAWVMSEPEAESAQVMPAIDAIVGYAILQAALTEFPSDDQSYSEIRPWVGTVHDLYAEATETISCPILRTVFVPPQDCRRVSIRSAIFESAWHSAIRTALTNTFQDRPVPASVFGEYHRCVPPCHWIGRYLRIDPRGGLQESDTVKAFTTRQHRLSITSSGAHCLL